jgi:hypothetical protein
LNRYVQGPESWQHVAHDTTLRRALDTYLQFRRRPHEDPGGHNVGNGGADGSVAANAVGRWALAWQISLAT